MTAKVVAASPDAILIVVSNPLDAMCHVAKNVSGWPRERVLGMAGILDTARFSTFIAWETGAVGQGRDRARPRRPRRPDGAASSARRRVGGVPLRKLVADERIAALVERTAKGGGELVGPARHLGLVRAGRGGGADGRRDHARREARAPVHRLPRGRVRDRRPLHGRAGEARRGAASRRSSSSSSTTPSARRSQASAAAVREVVGVLTTDPSRELEAAVHPLKLDALLRAP